MMRMPARCADVLGGGAPVGECFRCAECGRCTMLGDGGLPSGGVGRHVFAGESVSPCVDRLVSAAMSASAGGHLTQMMYGDDAFVSCDDTLVSGVVDEGLCIVCDIARRR